MLLVQVTAVQLDQALFFFLRTRYTHECTDADTRLSCCACDIIMRSLLARCVMCPIAVCVCHHCVSCTTVSAKQQVVRVVCEAASM